MKNRVRFRLYGVCSWIFALALVSFLSACGSDSSSGSDDTILPKSSASENSSQSAGTSSAGSENSGSSSSAAEVKGSSSSKAQETESSKEQLNDPQNKVSGTCAPTSSEIKKGEIATWKFYRASSDSVGVFEEILAPFVWTFEGASTTTVQGNGLKEASLRYEEAGSFLAYLNVDGNDIACSPLQVQGIPITVNSCTANTSTAKAGETITWTVDAASESNITGYEWTSSYGTVSGSGATGSMAATSDMHKKSVTATVAISNADKSKVTYLCEDVTVVDPESVDLVLALGSINDAASYGEQVLPTLPDSLFIPAQTATTVQIPAGAPSNCTVGCKPKVGADYMSTQIYWDSDEALSGFAYFSPSGCAPGKKYTVTASVTAICVVNAQ